jgi:hypothetical protein
MLAILVSVGEPSYDPQTNLTNGRAGFTDSVLLIVLLVFVAGRLTRKRR